MNETYQKQMNENIKNKNSNKGETKMKKVLLPFLLFGMIMATGCAASNPPVVVPESPQDHDHARPNMNAIGDYHAHLHVHHKKDRMSLYIYDIDENPMELPKSYIHGTITFPNGEEKLLDFESPNTFLEHGYTPTDVFSVSGDWIRKAYEFKIKFEIPIGDKIYETSFDYKTSDKEHNHRKHHGK